MIYSRTLASAMLAAFGAVGARPAARAATPTPNDATVVSLSVVPRTGRADVVVRIDGSVTFKHFTLSKPDKIVVDLSNATLGLPDGDAYDGVSRGGITRIRYSQFTKTVVRVVVTLDAVHDYTVTNENGAIRISIDGASGGFEPWAVGDKAAEKAEPLAKVDAPKADAPKADAPKVEAPKNDAMSEPPPRAAAPAAEPALAPVFAKPGTTPTTPAFKPLNTAQSQEPTFTWSWENAPISDVLAMFASYSRRTILPSKNVTGAVTANIINQPWDVALRAVMNANGYDIVVDDRGIIIVDTFEAIAARQATIPLQTRTVRLNYSRAISVANMVQARLTRTCPMTAQAAAAQVATGQPIGGGVQSISCPARGTVTADTITNAVSITDVPSAMPDLEQYARSLDLRQPQVNIKAKIILVDRSTLEGLGLRYDLGTQNQFFNDIIPRLDSTGKPRTDAGQIALGGNAVSAIANASARVPGAALQLVYSTAMGNYDFSTFLEALQTNTLLDVQAEPSTSVLNNRTANLTAGTQVPIRIIDAGSAAGNTSNAPRAQVNMQQTGIILTVTPQITANRQVQMKVHVENSDVQFQANDVGAVFPTQKVDNEVLVADGETAVMGGLTQTSVSVSRTGIPILVDLPIIGRLFGVTNRTETKRDLLILITPHIIDEGQRPDNQ
ncbi:MAG: AMIN domain-containing protein [Gemmatimonadaceae bacterium]